MTHRATPDDSARSAGTRPTLRRLRQRTRDVHERLERDLAIAAPAAGRREYARYVGAMWGWLAPVEPHSWAAPWPADLDVAVRATKTEWLDADVAVARAAGQLPDDLPRAAPRVGRSLAARFGQAYVIEGSMLGGAVLLQRLQPALQPWPLRFLHGYGARTGELWQRFLVALEREVVSDADVELAAGAAEATFVGIGDWLRVHAGVR